MPINGKSAHSVPIDMTTKTPPKRITRRAINALKPPAKGQAWLYDSELHGFLVLCQPSGRKTYLVRYKTPAGSWRKITLGTCAEMEPDDAREEARKVLAASRQGH